MPHLTLLLALTLHSATAYTLGVAPGAAVRCNRHAACVAAEQPFQSVADTSPVSPRALDQIVKATPDEKAAWAKRRPKMGKRSKRQTEQKAAKQGRGFGGAEVVAKRFDRRPADSEACGCGSDIDYGTCCKPIHEAGHSSDVSMLVKARYTAFAYRMPDFLIDTTSPAHGEWQADRGEWKKSLLNMCDSFVFEGLELESEPPPAADEAHVTFRAHLVQKGSIKMVDAIETSKFVRDGERWLYASGDVEYEATKVGTLPE